MRFENLPLRDARLVHLEPYEDARGSNTRLWCAEEFRAAGIENTPVQLNLIRNRLAGTIRGMHWQAPPWQESKLFRVLRGALHDVIVDLRPDSPTFMEQTSVELSAEREVLLFVPAGFAQGFQTLVGDTEVAYQVTKPYTEGAGRGARFDDPVLAISWPLAVTAISDKDLAWPAFTPPPKDT